ncbi:MULTISPECIES: hypothetical protein [unclassified Streptomyces]|uniref:hypothetical protein n=1 Tax=unclassified Streptomyces TaxID=2593676 RepID=UPI002349C4AD|nr:hypothetical protein [Streptomyces sp. M92]WCN05173.1 hypothetical protein M6G08_25410 [Streptomyces sp. M92]
MTERVRATVVTIAALLGLTAGITVTAEAAADAPAAADSTRPIGISTNYAWLRGEIFWDGTAQAAVYLKIHDTPQLTSNSWARVAYKSYYNGAWHQKYADDPFLSVGNGGTDDRAYQIPGPVKDVWVDLCSKRNGTTYCTGWK